MVQKDFNAKQIFYLHVCNAMNAFQGSLKFLDKE